MTELRDLPPSAKYVLDVVEREGPIRRQALLAETDLAESTLQDALDRLETRQRIVRTRKSEDLRQTMVQPVTE